MIHSHLSYCINVYGCAYTTSLQRLRVKQKESIRIVNNVGYRDHTPLLFKENQILPLDDMIKFAKLKLMHCYVNLKLPLSFHGIWPQNRDVNPARILRNANDLRVPPHHFATIKRLPMFNFPQAWNEEEERKSIPSLKLYCKTLKIALRGRSRLRGHQEDRPSASHEEIGQDANQEEPEHTSCRGEDRDSPVNEGHHLGSSQPWVGMAADRPPLPPRQSASAPLPPTGLPSMPPLRRGKSMQQPRRDRYDSPPRGYRSAVPRQPQLLGGTARPTDSATWSGGHARHDQRHERHCQPGHPHFG